MADRASTRNTGSLAPPAENAEIGQAPEGGDLPEDQLKKPKKKKLTKEEKRERKRLREIEAKKFEMMTEYKRELELSRKTAKRLNADWQESLREMKLVELKQELVVWEQKAMSQLNEKDEKIQDLLEYINSQEETNFLVAAQIKGFFDYLMDIYKALTDGSNILYKQAASEMISDFYKELNERHDHNRACRTHYESAMHTTNFFFEHGFLKDYEIFVERRNDKVNIEIERRYRIRDGIVKKMKATKQQLISFVEEVSSTELDPKKYERIRQLTKRQRFFSAQSERLAEIADKKKTLHSHLQRELLQTEMKNQKKITNLRSEQSYFFQIRKAIQNAMNLDDALTLDKIKVLSSESYEILQHFKKIAEYGELLISTAASVRKCQTEAEKVISSENFEPIDNSETDEFRRFMLTIIDPNKLVGRDDQELYYEMNSMRVFWRRVAIVEAQNAMLKKEKHQLSAENKKYTNFIREMGQKDKPEGLCDKIVVRSINLAPPRRF